MIKEVIVVEGKDDTAAILRAVHADTIETGGSAINREVLERIRLAHERRGVIIFTDPDFAGKKIRKIIAAYVPGCKHAFLAREEATCKDKVGVEYASPEMIRKALERVKTETETLVSEITWSDLLQTGLIHHPDAARRRKAMGQLLGIGYCNGKQFFKRCKTFQISRQEFCAAYQQMNLKE